MRPEQRASLLAAKLRTLVTDESGRWRRVASALEVAPFAAGSGLRDPSTGTAWLLVAPKIVQAHIDSGLEEATDPNPRGWLGGAMVLAHRLAIVELHVLLDAVTGHDARRAAVFTGGDNDSAVIGGVRVDGGVGVVSPQIWRVVGRSVEPVAAEVAVVVPASKDQLARFATLISASGATLVVDHGVVRAEALGLEVGRVVTGEDGFDRLDVGVGKHDRLANAMMGNDRDPEGSLRNAVEAVLAFRRAGAPPHPANQLARERWLREIVRTHPGLAVDSDLVGPAGLVPIESSHPAALKTLGPALLQGRRVIVACSVGLDLDALVDAADIRDRVAPASTVVLVVPAPDAFPALHTMANLIPNASLVTVPEAWSDAASTTAAN